MAKKRMEPAVAARVRQTDSHVEPGGEGEANADSDSDHRKTPVYVAGPRNRTGKATDRYRAVRILEQHDHRIMEPNFANQ